MRLSNVSSFCCAASPPTSAQRFTELFGVSSNGLLEMPRVESRISFEGEPATMKSRRAAT